MAKGWTGRQHLKQEVAAERNSRKNLLGEEELAGGGLWHSLLDHRPCHVMRPHAPDEVART